MSRASDVRRVGAASSSASTLSAALERESGRSRVTIGLGSCGIAAGARSVFDVLLGELAGTADIVSVGCRGLCFAEPLVGVAWPDGRTALYGNVDAAAAARIAEGVRVGEIKLEALSDDVIAGQERRVLVFPV